MKLEKRNIIQLVCSVAIICFLSVSCRKSNLQETILASMTPADSVSREVNSLATNFLNSGLITNAKEFSQKTGLPLWNQTLYVIDNQGVTDRNIYFVPFKKTNDNGISAYMVCYRFSDSLYDYRLYGKDVVNAVVTKNDLEENDLVNVACLFAYFEKKINGRDSIVIGQRKHLIRNIELSIGFRRSSHSNDGKQITALGRSMDYYIDMDFMGGGGESGYFDYASWEPYTGSNQSCNSNPESGAAGGYNPNGFAESGGASATGAKSNEAELQNWWDWSETNNQNNSPNLINPGNDFAFYFGGDDRGKIDDLQKFFSCFNSIPDNGAKYSITLCVDIPNVNDPLAILSSSTLSAGHAFITMQKENGNSKIAKSFGFYPQNEYLSISYGAIASMTKDNGNRQYDASITMNISSLDFTTVQNMAVYLSTNMKYDLDDYNCTDYALQVFNSVRNSPLIIPDWVVQNSGTNYGTIPNGVYKLLNGMQDANVKIGATTSPSSTPCK